MMKAPVFHLAPLTTSHIYLSGLLMSMHTAVGDPGDMHNYCERKEPHPVTGGTHVI